MILSDDLKASPVCVRLGKSIYSEAARWLTCLAKWNLYPACKVILSFVIFLCATNASSAENIDDKILIERKGLSFNSKTNTYDQIIRLKNISKEFFLAPIVLKINITPASGVAVYNAYTDHGGDFILIPDFANGVFGPAETKDVVIKFSSTSNQKFKYTTSLSGSILNKEKHAATRIRVYEFSGNNDAPLGPPILESGIRIIVNGAFRGITDSSGEIFLVALAGKNEIVAQKSLTESGTVAVDLHSGDVNEVKVIFDSGKEIFGDARLISDQIQQGVFRGELSSMNMRLISPNGEILKLAALDSISLSFENKNSRNITHLFEVFDDTTIKLVNVEEMRRLLQGHVGKVHIEVVVTSKNEIPYFETISFHFGAKIENENVMLEGQKTGTLCWQAAIL